MTGTEFYMPVEVFSGPGCLSELDRFRGIGSRAAIVCGRRSARSSGALAQVLAHFPGALVLDNIPENPDTAICESHAVSCRASRIDCLIGLGGGSAMDAAKSIALLAANAGPCDMLFEASNIQTPALPLLCIPTTAGTGSEVTPYAVLVDSAQHGKKTLKHPSLFPRAAFLDPRLTLGLPRDVTVATALDALSQAMEGMASRRSTALGNILALECCRLIRKTLPRVLHSPDDENARGILLHAAMFSGIVIAHSGTTLVHGMGYYYTLDYGIPHGAANGLLLPPVFQWNARHKPEVVAVLADALGRPCDTVPEFAAAAIFAALHDFYAEIGFAPAARDHGVPREAAARCAASIIMEPYRFKNQVGDFTETDVARLYEAAWEGGGLKGER